MKLNKKTGKGFLAFILLFGLLSVYLVAAAISPSLNLNGLNRFTITNYTSIEGIGNLSVGSGNITFDISFDGSTNIIDTHGYNFTLTDGMIWTELTTFPVACPANSYITQLDDSVTCTAINTIVTLNVTSNFTLPLNNFPACSAALEGNIRMNTTSHHPMYCNTTAWVQI